MMRMKGPFFIDFILLYLRGEVSHPLPLRWGFDFARGTVYWPAVTNFVPMVDRYIA